VKRYLIFERPKGSKCWTLNTDRSFTYHMKKTANDWVAQMKSSGSTWEFNIASVDLPEGKRGRA